MNQTTKLKINESKTLERDEPMSVIPMNPENHQYIIFVNLGKFWDFGQ